MLDKLTIRKLDIYTLPLERPPGEKGGRIQTRAGEIAQVVSGPAFRFLAYLEFQCPPSVARGNHYHTHKDERIYIVTGRLRATCKDIDSGETTSIMVESGDLLHIRPRCAHVFVPLEYSQALEFAPDPFDPTDTYSYMLETRDET